MTQFIGLRPKLYSFEYLDRFGVVLGKNTAKGVQKSHEKTINFQRLRQVSSKYEYQNRTDEQY